jgi:hypothetical protein
MQGFADHNRRCSFVFVIPIEVEIALASIRGNISIARKGSASGGLRKNSTLVIQSIFRCTTMEKETDRND